MPVAREFLLYYLRKDVDELLRRFCVSLDGDACRSWHRAFLKGCRGGTINLEWREITQFRCLTQNDMRYSLWMAMPAILDRFPCLCKLIPLRPFRVSTLYLFGLHWGWWTCAKGVRRYRPPGGSTAIFGQWCLLPLFVTQTVEGTTTNFPSFTMTKTCRAIPQDTVDVSGISKYSLIVQLHNHI